MNDETNVEVTETTTAPELPETPVETAPEVKEPVAPVKADVGIKETLELFAGLDLITDIAAAVMADGKIDWSDFSVLAAKLKDMDKLASAVEGAGDIKAELSNLDQAELVQVVMAAYGSVRKGIEAAKKMKGI